MNDTYIGVKIVLSLDASVVPWVAQDTTYCMGCLLLLATTFSVLGSRLEVLKAWLSLKRPVKLRYACAQRKYTTAVKIICYFKSKKVWAFEGTSFLFCGWCDDCG